jgi:hypothetical protein
VGEAVLAQVGHEAARGRAVVRAAGPAIVRARVGALGRIERPGASQAAIVERDVFDPRERQLGVDGMGGVGCGRYASSGLILLRLRRARSSPVHPASPHARRLVPGPPLGHLPRMRFAFALWSTSLLTLGACPGGGGDTDSATDTSTATSPTTTTTDASTGTATTTPDTGTSAPTTGDPLFPCNGSLPAEGSACETEGEVCPQQDDLCVAFTAATCEGGKWVHFDNVPGPECGEDSCDPNDPPLEGDPCTTEGASCSTDCSDVCLFCNKWTCSEGMWTRIEVFPEPCLECDAICDFVIVPMCPGGPPDKAACVSGCEDSKAGACKAEFSDLRACAGEQPTFICDMSGRPLVAGCEAEFTAFYDCSMP